MPVKFAEATWLQRDDSCRDICGRKQLGVDDIAKLLKSSLPMEIGPSGEKESLK